MLALARKFRSAESGAVSLIFAFSLLGLLAMMGLGVDYAFYQRAQSRLQTAVDVAALAAGRMGAIATADEKDAVAKKMFDQHISRLPGLAAAPDLSMSYDKADVTAQGTATINTTLLRLAGVSTMTVHATSHVAGQPQITMALALDVTGSMRDQDITALQNAAKQVVEIVTDNGSNKDNYVSIVPFAAFVNIGTGAAQEKVLDKDGIGLHAGQILKGKKIATFGTPYDTNPAGGYTAAQANLEPLADKLHQLGTYGLENIVRKWFKAPYSTTKDIYNPNNPAFPISNWELLKVMHARSWGAGWNGCVEARPEPYDISTAQADTNNGDTLYEPFFMYDAMDGAKPVDFLPDAVSSDYFPDVEEDNDTSKKFSLLKYLDPDGSYKSWQQGTIDDYCPPAIEPLTNDKDTLDDLIDTLDQVSGGGTIISEGFMWAWRTIEDIAPFPRPDGAEILGNPQKIILLMTDGENNINDGYDSAFITQYSAYGNVGAGYMPGVSTRAQAATYLDGRLKEACAAASNDDVIIFTVLYRTNSTRSSNLLKACASGTNRFFMASDPASLVSVFQKIADDVKKLRITG